MTKKSRPQSYPQPINHSPSHSTFLLFTIPMPLLKPRLPISSLLRPHSHQSCIRYISMTKTKMASAPAVAAEKKQINLLRGWPNPSLLPTPLISAASQTALSNPDISIPGLLYGPDPGYQPLREEISRWMGRFYSGTSASSSNLAEDPERICITGGASQNLACVLQVFSDPVRTKVWMVAPCYFLACRIFGDAGLTVRAVGEGSEGVDLEGLERRLIESEKEDRGKVRFFLYLI
jgi:DNA-binding transcriptional MocR family regulator